MIISSRLSRILQICLQRDVFITVDELASMLQISKRTIFRELSDIDQYLSSYSLTLISKPKMGMKIEGASKDKEALLNDLHIEKIEYVNKEERRNLLIFEILREKETQKLYYYANQFQVSESTISNDLDEIDAWFKKYDLQIVRTPGLGISLVGKESKYRQALTDIIAKSLQENEQFEKGNTHDALFLLENVFLHDQDGIMKLLNQDILKRVLLVFDEQQHILHLDKYAQSSYVGLIIHLTIAIERIMKEESIQENTSLIIMMQKTSSYEQASLLATYLEKEFEIDIPKAEIAFIAMHIQGAKRNAIQEDIEVDVEDVKIQTMLEDMVTYVDRKLQTSLCLDEELRCGLMVHLKPAFMRMQHHMRIYNPLLAQIKSDYQEIYEVCKEACQVWQDYFEHTIPEDEIGYIAMHFGAAMERETKNAYHMRPIKVGIVCSSGIGVSALLLARMRKVLDANVELITLSMDEAIHEKENCELYISTFQFASSKKLIVVNPLLDKEDSKQIKVAVEEIRKQPILQNKSNVSETIAYSTIEEDIFRLLDSVEVLLCEEMSIDEMLHYVARVFAKDEQANKEIYQALQQREKVCSSIYPSIHFALFHASLQCIETCTCKIIKPKHSEFTGELNELSFIIAMFMPKHSTRLQKQMMSNINKQMMEDEAFYETLVIGNEEAINQAMESIMKEFLFSTLKKKRGTHHE